MKTCLAAVAQTLLLFFTGVPVSLAQECVVRLGAFDIGSGSTKMRVADVDICTRKIKEIIESRVTKVDYVESFKRSENFPPQVMVEGLAVLRSLKFRAEQLNAKYFTAVATSAFRRAKNAPEMVRRIENDLKIPVQIISQKREAELGFYAASSIAEVAPQLAVVWDIGGASQQITALRGDGKYFLIHEGDFGSLNFRDRIITQIQKKQAKSPNPMTQEETQRAIDLASSLASKLVSSEIKNKIRKTGSIVLGIGGVHAFSIRGQVGQGDHYTQKQVSDTLWKRHAMTDAQIGGQYADTDISNLAFVLGYMKALGVDQVRSLEVNLTNGVFLQPQYWPKAAYTPKK